MAKMASSLSDDELRKKLMELGETVGPITESTRKVYEKRLDKIGQVKRRSLNRSQLDHFSSDESEVERSPPSSTSANRRSLRFNRSLPSDLKDDHFKVPDSPTARTLRANDSLTRPSVHRRHSKRFSFDIDSSDSDVDPDQQGRATKKQSKYKANESFGSSLLSSNWNNVHDKTDIFHNGNRSTVQISSGLNHISSKANGYTSDDSTLRKAFKIEDNTATSTNYSQCISMFLVIVTTLFFVVVGILYVGVKQKDLPTAVYSKYSLSVCEEQNGNSPCIRKEEYEAQDIAWKLYNILADIAGKYECSENQQSRNLSLEDARDLLIKLEDSKERRLLEKEFNYALELIMQHEDWGIRLYDKDGNKNINIPHVNDIHSLEAVIATKSLWCRFRQAFLQTSIKLLCLILVLTIIIGIVFFIRLYKKTKLLEEKKLFTLVEKIIDVLKKESEKYPLSTENESGAVMAIAHVRDMLIPPAERKFQLPLWEKAVRFLEQNESRVRVERQNIAGEDYKVWRWIQPNILEISGNHRKVWQGQAFGNSGRSINVPSHSPSPCLKIRNMFDPEVEYEDDWQIYIKDAILEKCENNNIVHIHVDVLSSEGCVYVKCLTPESAGQAYRNLHGCWFDKKLVTVKYLRLERYHERFPESKYCITPLKPSNDLRLSMSAPFHISPLESS